MRKHFEILSLESLLRGCGGLQKLPLNPFEIFYTISALYNAEALLLAGVDYLVVGPKVLEELNQQYTMQGYNDGMTFSRDSARSIRQSHPFFKLSSGFVASLYLEDLAPAIQGQLAELYALKGNLSTE